VPPRTPLLRPDRFFAERDFHATRLLIVGTILVFSLPAAVGGVGWVLTDHVDGTVMVDNPERPPDTFCESAPDSMTDGCDAPAQIEQDVDVLLRDAMDEFMGPALLGFPIVLAILAGVLHAGAWMADGTGGVGESIAITLWGLVPSIFALPLAIGLMALLLDPMTVSPGANPSLLVEQLRTDLQPMVTWGPIISGVTTLWGAAIWRFGLEYKRGLDRVEASVLAGIVAVLFWAGSLL